MKDLEKKLVVGLGNPGEKYAFTRHNMGFYVIDQLAKLINVSFKKEKKTLFARKEELFLLKPQSYMNLSGGVLLRFLKFYQIHTENVLVVVDDACLAFGKLRIRKQGASGGHNGLRDIEEALKTKHYSRLRIGVGSPKEDSDMADYVLAKFSKEEQKKLPEIAKNSISAIELWLHHGVYRAMNEINVHPKTEGENG